MKKVLFVLFATMAIASSVHAQQFKIEKSAGFEATTNWYKLLQLKNGNTMLFSYEFKAPLFRLVSINFQWLGYDKSRKEIFRKSIKPEKWNGSGRIAKGIYEINGEAVLFIMCRFDEGNHELHRIRINGVTGDLISDDILGKLPRMGPWGKEAMQWANADPNNIYVEKDPATDCYAVVFFNGFAKDRNERIRTIHYDGSHKIVSEAFYESPEGAFKYLTYVGMAIDGRKKLFLSTYGRNGTSSDQKPRLIISALNSGDTLFKHNVLDFTEEFGFTKSLMIYNHNVNRIQMLSLTEVKSKTNLLTSKTTTYYALLLSTIDPDSLRIVDARLFGATKATEYARKNVDPDFNFTGMPQDMILNSDNTITILSEEMKSIIEMPVLVSIGVSDLSDTLAELRGYIINKRQYGGHQPLLVNRRRNGYYYGMESSGVWDYMSYMYIDAPGGRYIIFNDLDENFKKKETDTRRAVLQKPSEGNTVCCRLGENKVDRFYLFGEPQKRKTAYCNLDASSYDNNTHTLAALVYNADDARPEDIAIAWVTFE